MLRTIILGLMMLCLPAGAQGAPELAPEAVVREVTDGDTLTLDNGEVVRLTGIQAPKLALGRPGFQPWPLAEKARSALVKLTQGRKVQYRSFGARTDRHRRTLAHLYRAPDGLWIQGEMLRLGLARVYTFNDNRAMAAEMLALEGEARAAKRGVWGHEFYAVRGPENLYGLSDSFQLIEGRVLESARRRDYVFLNFGADYKTDFTVVIGRGDWPRFAAAGVDPQSYNGKSVRVRGWLEYWNGPLLRVSHPEQIEILE